MATKTKDWILPNRFFFTKWFYQNFHPSQYVPKENHTGFEPDSSQKLIRDFIHTESPYRGLLVYHELGTGKSCASILATDSFVKQKKKVVVLLPASLENNYRKELNKCSITGSLHRKKWTKVRVLPTDLQEIDLLKNSLGIKKDFITKNKTGLWIPFVPKDFPESKILQKDVPFKSMDATEQQLAEDTYQYLIDQRYTFIHYNGLTNKKLDELEAKDDFGEDIFDNAIVVIDEVHTFISRVIGGGKIAKRLYNHLISKPNLKLVLLSGTPIINHPFEICYTLNLLRGPMTEYTLTALKDKKLPDVSTIIDVLHANHLYQHIDMLELDPTQTTLRMTLLPKGFVRKEKEGLELVKGALYYDEKKMMEKITKTIKGEIPINARFKTEEYTAFPDKRETFVDFFMDFSDPMYPRIKHENIDLFTRRIQGIVSYYRIADEELFPKALEPIIKRVQMSNPQFSYYAEVRGEEIKKDDIQQKKRQKGKDDLFKTNSSYRAYSRMACNFVFPEEIKRPFPKDIRAKILRREIDIQEEDDIEDKETEKEEKEAEKGAVQQSKLYEQEVKEALHKLEKNGDKYLQGKGLYDCSPKMYSLLQDLQTNGKKSLLYSQFRTVEGLRIFRMVLNQAGWKEIDFKQKGKDDWAILNAEEVLDPKYDNKRYLVFGDKEKTDLLIQLFNADIRFLPKTIQEQLQTANQTENLRGKLASLLMITQSGAEGLNLRNVRYVYILEPFWNQVRINQVVGRAIRKRSHLELPENERNVQVVLYQSVFSAKQASSNKTIKIRDNGQTTDENVYELARKKDKLIQVFLTAIKSNAIDCIFHASKNKPLTHNYRCYIPPINVDNTKLSFLPNIEDDKKSLSFGTKERVKKIQGKAVSKDGTKYVVLSSTATAPQLYDYHAYKDAGVLVEALTKQGTPAKR